MGSVLGPFHMQPCTRSLAGVLIYLVGWIGGSEVRGLPSVVETLNQSKPPKEGYLRNRHQTEHPVPSNQQIGGFWKTAVTKVEGLSSDAWWLRFSPFRKTRIAPRTPPEAG